MFYDCCHVSQSVSQSFSHTIIIIRPGSTGLVWPGLAAAAAAEGINHDTDRFDSANKFGKVSLRIIIIIISIVVGP